MRLKWRPPRSFVVMSAIGSFVGGVVIFKDILGGGNYNGPEELEGKTVIITGANTGIGRETAHEMARRKARVIMACRDLEKCKEARKDIVLDTKNKKVACWVCDLASQESIRNFAKRVNEEESRLDILVNNAGVMRCEQSVTKEGIELQLGTNHMGHFLLTNLLLNKLKESAPSRIINVSSVAHTRGKINFEDLNSANNYDAADAYAQSKLANILFTLELAQRLKGTGVTSNAVHPGIVNTDLSRHMSIAKSWIAAVFARPILWLFLKTPRQGAQTTIYAALSQDLQAVSGKYYSNQEETELSKDAQDMAAARRLWAISEHWTRLS
ncbi:retinol dehydrogenase 13-like isoform X1 [Oratosquilla oratoria]|uniref:retinol dehydrogenase 13-like isoform X1 n=2 Tax=Oratosquilla oratoria TaxID=337810 RepID=UPI003F76AE25